LNLRRVTIAGPCIDPVAIAGTLKNAAAPFFSNPRRVNALFFVLILDAPLCSSQ
jgi:hypothetical protein